jgi:hypothetical protein
MIRSPYLFLLFFRTTSIYIYTGDLRSLLLMNFFCLKLNIYKCGYCLEVWFNRCDDGNVKKTEATNDGCEGEKEKGETADVDGCAFWQTLHFFCRSHSHKSIRFFCTCFHFYFFFAGPSTSNNITNISVRTTQTRAHIRDRSSYSPCTFFFMLIRSFFSVPLVSYSLSLWLYVCLCEYTYTYSQHILKNRRKKIIGGRQWGHRLVVWALLVVIERERENSWDDVNIAFFLRLTDLLFLLIQRYY